MRGLTDLWFRIRALFRPGAMERDLDEELEFHVQMETERLIREGVPPEEAAREGRRRMDGAVRPRQVVRDAWGVGVVWDFLADVRHALRQFRRRPGFSLLGILTLGVGLGATIGLLGVIRSVLVRPLPFADEDGVRIFWSDYDWRGVEFDFVKEQTRAFQPLAAFSADASTLRGETSSTVLLTGVTSAEFFDVLGATPLLGRTFRPGEDRPGSEPVTVLSYGAWQQELGGDPEIVGRRIVLNGRPVTVIGVMPRDFYFPTPEFRLWAPLDLDPASGQYQSNGWLVLFGRVRPGLGEAQVRDDIAAIARALGERFTYPAAWDKTRGASSRTAREYLVGDVRPALLLVFGAGALLLLMATANVAALILARTTDRSQEISLRAALGAGRGRLARQIVAEALTFSLLAGAVGVVAATLGFDFLVRSLPLENGLAARAALDWGTFLLAFVLASVVGLVVALAPVRDLLRGRLAGGSGTRGAMPGSRAGRVHQGLVGVEAGVATLLAVGALMLIRSVSGLLALDLGFEPSGVVAVDLAAAGEDLTAPERDQAYRAILERVTALPGVEGAAWTNRLPVRDGGWQGPVSVEGNPDLQGPTSPNALYRRVSADYFRVMGISLLSGRLLEPGDRVGTERVTVINRAFAERAWPGMSPIGRRVRAGVTGDSLTVVGVVEEVRSTAVTGDNPFVLYVADEQTRGGAYKVLVARVRGPATPFIAAVGRIAAEVDPRIAANRPTTMPEVVETALAEPIQLRFFLTLFATLALGLGVVGVYSVASYSVARRQTELGLRMALGAAPRQVLGQILREGMGPVALGTAAGLGAAVVLARIATRFLYGVSPQDPLSMSAAALALLAAGMAAAFVPALRASRVSPVESLRAE